MSMDLVGLMPNPTFWTLRWDTPDPEGVEAMVDL